MKQFGLLASLLLAFVFLGQAQVFGPTPAARVSNSACSAGQIPTYDGNKKLSGCGNLSGSGNYQNLQVAGTLQTARGAVNWIGGNGVATSCADDAANSRTNCKNDIDSSAVLTNRNAQLGSPFNCTATGTTTLACSMSPAISNCPDITTVGWTVRIIPGSNSGAAPTLAVGSCSAISLRDSSGNALASGALVAGRPYTFVSDGTNLIQQGGAAGVSTAKFFNPSGGSGPVNSSAAPRYPLGAANQIVYYWFYQFLPVTFSTYKFRTGTGTATFGFAITDLNCQVISGSTGTVVSPGTDNFGTITLGSPLTLPAGEYYMAWTANAANQEIWSAGGQDWNGTFSIGGVAAFFYNTTSSSSGVIPNASGGTCGSRTAINVNGVPFIIGR